MPDEPITTDELDEQQLEPEAQAEERSETSPGGYVTREDYEHLQRQMETLQQNLGYALQQRQTPQAAQPQAPQRLTNEQIQEMLEEGKAAEVMRALAREEINTGLRPELDNLRNVGMASLERIAKRDGLSGKKYADRFRDKIEEYMRQLPVESRVMPEFYEMAYNVVVGQNMDALMNEEFEARQRRAANPVQDMTTDRRPGRRRGADAQSTQPEDMFEPDVLAQLNQKGGPDAWAQTFGYDNWQDYVTRTQWNDEWLADYQVGGKRH